MWRQGISAIVLCLSVAACGVEGNPTLEAPAPVDTGEQASTPDTQQILQGKLDAFLREYPDSQGAAVVLLGPGDALETAAVGVAAPDGRLMTSTTPVRLASVTKTFVAATALSLSEQGLIDLHHSIRSQISPDFNDALLSAGFDTALITPRYLLMHVSGLPDHAGNRYVAMVIENPAKQWDALEQVSLLQLEEGERRAPEEGFEYSDTGYVLLGHIIERATGGTLAQAVRKELRLDDLALSATWWEQAESIPQTEYPRAHQYVDGADTHDWNPSMDLYGGGGIVANMEDLAVFMSALMRGDLTSAAVLEQMKTAPGHPFPDQYRMGLFPMEIAGYDAYGHGGFWGIRVLAIPELDLVIAGVSLEQNGYRPLSRLMIDVLEAEAATSDK